MFLVVLTGKKNLESVVSPKKCNNKNNNDNRKIKELNKQ